MIKLKSLLNENIRTNSMVKIIRIFKKLGIVVKKSTPIKKGFMNSKSELGFFVTVYDRKTKQEGKRWVSLLRDRENSQIRKMARGFKRYICYE